MLSSKIIRLFRSSICVPLLALFLSFIVVPKVVVAQEWDHWDHMNGRDKVHDPAGLWLLNTSITEPDGENAHMVINFHAGGTLTFDVQGASAFDPAAVTDPAS